MHLSSFTPHSNRREAQARLQPKASLPPFYRSQRPLQQQTPPITKPEFSLLSWVLRGLGRGVFWATVALTIFGPYYLI